MCYVYENINWLFGRDFSTKARRYSKQAHIFQNTYKHKCIQSFLRLRYLFMKCHIATTFLVLTCNNRIGLKVLIYKMEHVSFCSKGAFWFPYVSSIVTMASKTQVQIKRKNNANFNPAVSGGGSVKRLSLGKLLLNLLQVVKRTNTRLIPWQFTNCGRGEETGRT